MTHRRIRSAGRLPANPQPPLKLAPPDGPIAARVEGLHPGDVGRNPAVESAQALQKEVGKRSEPMKDSRQAVRAEMRERRKLSAHEQSIQSREASSLMANPRSGAWRSASQE